MKQWSMFIGRWQPWHKGHRWLIDQRLNEGKNVLVEIRYVEPKENQPSTSNEVLQNVTKELLPLINQPLNIVIDVAINLQMIVFTSVLL